MGCEGRRERRGMDNVKGKRGEVKKKMGKKTKEG